LGCSYKQIARKLALTPPTVDGYLTEARRLLDARRGLFEAVQVADFSTFFGPRDHQEQQ